MPQDTRAIVKIGLDFLLLLTVGIPVLIYHLHGRPTIRGFNCDDDSIRYPYRDSTINNNVLYIVGIFLPVTVIPLNKFHIRGSVKKKIVDLKKVKNASNFNEEYICVTEFSNEAWSKRESRGQVYILLGRPIPHVIWSIYKRIGIFLFGACMSQLTTDIAKYSIGRLRPHFLSICQPNVNCSLEDPHEYIVNFVCLGRDQNAIREARLSFPSGHSSFSAYTMVFTVIYLQACMRCKTNRLLRPFLQFILLMMTWYTALSRIADYKHHWSDVLIGFLLGIIAAVIVAS
ncbi:UNVERIFIED_CONTAM: wun [Trichonephila clavipes]